MNRKDIIGAFIAVPIMVFWFSFVKAHSPGWEANLNTWAQQLSEAPKLASKQQWWDAIDANCDYVDATYPEWPSHTRVNMVAELAAADLEAAGLDPGLWPALTRYASESE